MKPSFVDVFPNNKDRIASQRRLGSWTSFSLSLLPTSECLFVMGGRCVCFNWPGRRSNSGPVREQYGRSGLAPFCLPPVLSPLMPCLPSRSNLSHSTNRLTTSPLAIPSHRDRSITIHRPLIILGYSNLLRIASCPTSIKLCQTGHCLFLHSLLVALSSPPNQPPTTKLTDSSTLMSR